jgi:hypothetical protein
MQGLAVSLDHRPGVYAGCPVGGQHVGRALGMEIPRRPPAAETNRGLARPRRTSDGPSLLLGRREQALTKPGVNAGPMIPINAR